MTTEIPVYEKGDMRRLSMTFKNLAGTPTDPTTIRYRTKRPSGAAAELVHGVDGALVRDSAGVFHVDQVFDEAGDWLIQWVGEGAIVGVDVLHVFVHDAVMAAP